MRNVIEISQNCITAVMPVRQIYIDADDEIYWHIQPWYRIITFQFSLN